MPVYVHMLPLALLVPPPCLTFLHTDVTLVPVNLAVFLSSIGNGTLKCSAFLNSDSEM